MKTNIFTYEKRPGISASLVDIDTRGFTWILGVVPVIIASSSCNNFRSLMDRFGSPFQLTNLAILQDSLESSDSRVLYARRNHRRTRTACL